MRIAFIGGTGHFMLKGSLSDPDFQVDRPVAVASDTHSPDAARTLAKNLEAEWFDDPIRMLETYKPDVVNIGAVYGYNGDMIAAAVERGIPVVSDKPIVATWAQLDRLRSLAGQNNIAIATEFDARSRAPFRAAQQAVRDGAIGRLVLATAQKSYRLGTRPKWFGRRADFGGLMLWVASHAIDFVTFCSGADYRRVVGVQGNLAKPQYPEMEDHTVAMFEMTGGAHAVVHADYLRPDGAPTHGDDRLRLVGSDGVIEILDGHCHLIDATGRRELSCDHAPRPMHVELIDAAMNGNTALFGTAQSLHMAEVLLCARDAADQGAWVDIPRARQ